MKENKIFPDYNNCIVNISNSILKDFGVNPINNTHPIVDKYLEKEFKNVVLLLLDGLGTKVIEHHLTENDFFIKNCVSNVTSVFPSATVPATTSILSAKYPIEHGWLGWFSNIDSIDQTILTFLDCDKNMKRAKNNYSFRKEYGYKTICDLINEKTNYNAKLISPFEGETYDIESYDVMFKKIVAACETDNKNFVYSYCVNPDQQLHKVGVRDDSVSKVIRMLQNQVEELSKSIDDALIIVCADHGMKDICGYININDYKDLKNMLYKDVSLEFNVPTFFVKEEYILEFKTQFNKILGNDFELLTRLEALELNLFGIGKVTKNFDTLIGDYIAISKKGKIFYEQDEKDVLASHGALTSDEMLVPLILIET